MSSLHAKLDALRRQGGSAAPAPAVPPDSLGELRARIERLQARGTARDARPAAADSAADDATLAGAVDGVVVDDGVVLVERRVADGTRHGHTHLTSSDVPAALDAFTDVRPRRPEDVVYMDTETTGLAGGTGTMVFLLGMARFDRGALHVRQYLLTRFIGEPRLLAHAGAALAGASHLVTFNGRSFDAPLLATRYRLGGSDDPFARLAHVDLLSPTRRAFRGCWENCRLVTAEQRLLGFHREHDLPGAEAPDAWFDWVRRGRIGVLPAVLEHNHRDIVSLAALAVMLREALANPLAYGARAHRAMLPGDGACDDEALYDYLARNRARLDPEARTELASLARRRGHWALAVDLWEELAHGDDANALERLAKYHEHVSRDLRAALGFTARLLERQPDSPAHRYRGRRLERKLATVTG